MTLLKVLNKTTIFALLLILSGSQIARAQTKLYQSDSSLPFVKMMMSMMEAMGILDRVPARGAYGQYGQYGNTASPWSGYSNNPFSRTPWSQSNHDGASPVWGSPDWGVLPTHKYSYYSYGPYGTRWSSTDLDGWVKEPWESSEWNPEAEAKAQVQPPVQMRAPQRAQPAQPIIPIVQNFNYNSPEAVQQREGQGNNVRANNRLNNIQQKNKQLSRPSPLAKLLPSRQNPRPAVPPGAQARNQFSPPQLSAKQSKKQHRQEKPFVTDFCGLKKPNLNGLWVAQDGEMLGIKNKRYLWTDGDSRYLTGQLKVQNEYLLANVDGHEKLMRFKYKLSGNHLLTMQPDGKIREFVRTPNNRYDGQYPGYSYDQGYGQGYGRYPGQYSDKYSGSYYR